MGARRARPSVFCFNARLTLCDHGWLKITLDNNFRPTQPLIVNQDRPQNSSNQESSGTLPDTQSGLKPLAVICKVFASIEAIAVAWFMIGLDVYMLRATEPPRDIQNWGTPAYYHRLYFSIAITSLLAILVIIPNRWLVFSRVVFVPLIIIALLPLCFSLFLIFSDFDLISHEFLETLEWWMISIFFSVPWPLSLIFSRMRFRRGGIFMYA